MEKVHPLYKIIAVLCVGSVAKALFAEPRPINNITQNIAKGASDVVADRLSEAVKH